MSQDDIKMLMEAAAVGSRDSIHKRLGQILLGMDGRDRRAKLAELNAELASEHVEMYQHSDRVIVASVIRQNRESGR